MGTILSTGIGSGLDIAGLVSQLVAAEGRPQAARLDTNEAQLQAKLSAIGTLRAALDTLSTAIDGLADLDSFDSRKVTLASPDYFTATATSAAATGSYDVEVQALASAQRLASGPFAGSDAAVGTGTLTIAIGGLSFAVDIAAGSESLAGIRDAINDSPLNTGVVATLLNGVDGTRLILTGATLGAASQIVVTASGGDGGLTALEYDPANSIANLTELRAAADARVLIDGFAAESSTNTITDAIDGISLSLAAVTDPGATVALTIEVDRDVGKAAIDKFVQAYNGFIDIVASVTRYDPDSGTKGALLGDAGLRSILFQLRRELTGSASGTFGTLSQLGIATELDGKLSVDAAKLTAAFDEDFEAVGEFFTGAQTGLGARLDALLEPYVQSGGVLDARREGLQVSIKSVGERRDELETRMAALEQRLLRQFNALDSLLAELQSTSGFLAQQLENLPGAVTFRNNRNT